jgi:hypothetical protein
MPQKYHPRHRQASPKIIGDDDPSKILMREEWEMRKKMTEKEIMLDRKKRHEA